MGFSSPNLGNRGQRFAVLLVCVVLSLSALSFSANTYYVSQSGGSVNCGADGTQTSQPYSWVNASGHYAAGDTIKLCGTINGPNTVGGTVFTLQASGSSGNPITMFWESNAGIAEPACGTGNGNACIKTNNQTYWVLDGNLTKNSITSTANGTAGTYANQVPANGIWALNCSNCEFKNLDVSNMYVMVGANDSAPTGFSWDPSGLVISGSNYLIHNNSFEQMRSGVVGGLWNDGDSNNRVYNNTFNHIGGGIIYVGNTSGVLSNIFVYGNHISNMATWDNVNDYYHHDGIFFCNNSGDASSVKNIYIYDNLFDGDEGANCTAWIYYNEGLNGIYVFNNKFFNSSARSCAQMEGGYTGDQNFYVYNNYVDCGGLGDGATAMQYGRGGITITGMTVENNTFNNCDVDYDFNGVVIGAGTIDHNVYGASNCTGSRCFQWNGNTSALAAWQAICSCDTHSLSPSSTGADSSGMPQAGSAMIHDGTLHFANLASLCTGSLTALCTDYAGNPRPNSGTMNWDAGAYLYGSSAAPSPPSGLQATVE